MPRSLRFTARAARHVAQIAALALASACGGRALTTPEGITITRYSKSSPVQLTVTMTTCSDRCAQYDPASCKVTVEDRVIDLEISVPYGDAGGVDPADCSLTCGPPVYAHCDAGTLAAGTYTVKSAGFEKEIVVE